MVHLMIAESTVSVKITGDDAGFDALEGRRPPLSAPVEPTDPPPRMEGGDKVACLMTAAAAAAGMAVAVWLAVSCSGPSVLEPGHGHPMAMVW